MATTEFPVTIGVTVSAGSTATKRDQDGEIPLEFMAIVQIGNRKK